MRSSSSRDVQGTFGSSSSEGVANDSQHGLFGSLCHAASDAAQALLGGLTGPASSGGQSAEQAAHFSSGNVVGAATPTTPNGSYHRRNQSHGLHLSAGPPMLTTREHSRLAGSQTSLQDYAHEPDSRLAILARQD